ncbi:PfkB family carbohydrate kinase [Atopococcus tabaci]|uniref:PfkB family carbohydrate kinase n=1 Tax=Atopococcus tabaci TaxID=269774 RepID=UPI000422A2CF|nr:PfkB family carbohydrate kinase [Atopococcus tabaci]
MTLNEKEAKVLGIIRENPYISQKELSEYVELSRSSVANIISGLVHKGYLVGRAYVVNDERPIVTIGGANIDRLYVVQDSLIQGTSNQVKSHTSVGGIARNVGENLGRLELPVTLVSMVGKDDSGQMIRTQSKPYMNVENLDETGFCPTGNFTEIVDIHGNLKLGLAEMDIYDQITPQWLNRYRAIIEKASCVVVDTNLPKDTMETLIGMTNRFRVPLVMVTSSLQKMVNIPDCMEGVTLLVTKHDEAAFYLDMEIEDDETLKESIRKWQELGVEKVLVTQDNEKIAYSSSLEDEAHIFVNPDHNKERYAWGAVEALTAGWVYAKYVERTDEEALIYGVVNSFQTSRKIYTVRQNLSQKVLQREYQDFLKLKGALPKTFEPILNR